MEKIISEKGGFYSEAMDVISIAILISMLFSIPLTPVFNGDDGFVEVDISRNPVKDFSRQDSFQSYYDDMLLNEKYFNNVDIDLSYLMKDVAYLNDKSLHIAMDFAKEKGLENEYVKMLDMTDLAYTLWCEERGSQKGMMYVASVILNRVASKHYPNTIYKVIHQKKQFSCWGGNGFSPVNKVDRDFKQFKRALKIAYSIYSKNFKKMTIATHYFASNKVNPYWANKGETLVKIGNHVFVLVK